MYASAKSRAFASSRIAVVLITTKIVAIPASQPFTARPKRNKGQQDRRQKCAGQYCRQSHGKKWQSPWQGIFKNNPLRLQPEYKQYNQRKERELFHCWTYLHWGKNQPVHYRKLDRTHFRSRLIPRLYKTQDIFSMNRTEIYFESRRL